MKLLITGADSYVGWHYVRHFAQIRPDAKVVASMANLSKTTELADSDNVEIFFGDLLDDSFTRQITSDIDIIVHCTAKLDPDLGYEECYQANVAVTERLIKCCRDAGVRRFVYVGSSSVYLDYNDHLNVTEEFLPVRFADNYARTQYQAECRVLRAHSDQLKTLCLRPHWVIGSEDAGLIGALLMAHANEQLYQVGEGRNIISMTSIENLMHAMDCAVFGTDDVTGDTYNIADPRPVNFWQAIESLLSTLGQPPITRKVTYPTAALYYGLRDLMQRLYFRSSAPHISRKNISLLVRSFTLNIEKARRKLGYHPKQSVEHSLQSFAQEIYEELNSESLKSVY